MVEKIESLTNKMMNLGYRQGEVNVFIHEVTGDKSIDKLTEDECMELLDHLVSYISFAEKSRALVKKS